MGARGAGRPRLIDWVRKLEEHLVDCAEDYEKEKWGRSQAAARRSVEAIALCLLEQSETAPGRPPRRESKLDWYVQELRSQRKIDISLQSALQAVQRTGNMGSHVQVENENEPSGLSAEVVARWHAEGAIEYMGEAADVRPHLRASTVYVLPSYREGMPRTVLEAMATGRAIVTSDAPGCRETVVEGDNGFLVPPRDVDALAAAMERFLIRPELCAAMGGRSRQMAVTRFDVHQVNAVMLAAMGLA